MPNMNVMGQVINKTKRSVGMQANNSDKPTQAILPVRILELDASIENRPTTIDEKSPAVLKYRTPTLSVGRPRHTTLFADEGCLFSASATLKFPPLEDGEHWKIGWIQACTRMDFFNSYGDSGYSSWEFPQLMSGQSPMISDSDGRKLSFLRFEVRGDRTARSLLRLPHCESTDE